MGDRVKVKVLDSDPAGRVWLSCRRVDVDPWDVFADEWVVGQTLLGTVTELRWNGALVRLGEGVEGAIHLSKLSAHPIAAPDEVVGVGDCVRVTIIGVDVGGGITLSLERRIDMERGE